MEWKPIESAPVQKIVLLGRVGEPFVVQAYKPSPSNPWRHVHSLDEICFEPTHWHENPAPPK